MNASRFKGIDSVGDGLFDDLDRRLKVGGGRWEEGEVIEESGHVGGSVLITPHEPVEWDAYE